MSTSPVYPQADRELTQMHQNHEPNQFAAFQQFSQQSFAKGALDVRTKQLIAITVAHVTQCPYCIRAAPRRLSRWALAVSKSWRPFGLPPKCERAPPMRIRFWHWIRCARKMPKPIPRSRASVPYPPAKQISDAGSALAVLCGDAGFPLSA